MIVLGITGSVANLLIMSGPAFTGSTFYYLRALSLCDMFYLVCVIGWKTLNEDNNRSPCSGYCLEIILLDSEINIEFETKFYFTHFDIALGNTFITTSGFIILLLTLDRWRAIVHPTWDRDTSPALSICLALISSLLIQVPRFWEKKIVNRCVRVNAVNNLTLLGGKCQCGGAYSFLGTDCRYETETEEEIVGSYPWIVYTVLTELIMKIIPAILLVVLNNIIIRKVKKTRAAVAAAKSCNAEQGEALKRRVFKIFRRRQHIISKRDRNLIDLFSVLYISFLVTNLPMAVVRILSGCGFNMEDRIFHEFRTLSNTLEALFASSNFYLYCLCNVQIRRKVTSWFRRARPLSFSRVRVRTITGRLEEEERRQARGDLVQ